MNKEHIIHVRVDEKEYEDIIRVTGGRKISSFIRDCVRMGVFYHIMTGRVEWDGNQKNMCDRVIKDRDGSLGDEDQGVRHESDQGGPDDGGHLER